MKIPRQLKLTVAAIIVYSVLFFSPIGITDETINSNWDKPKCVSRYKKPKRQNGEKYRIQFSKVVLNKKGMIYQ